MMWRAKWLAKELARTVLRADHRGALQRPLRYPLALLVKFVPGLHRAPIRLALKPQGILDARDFMSLYMFREIFIDGCYDIDMPVDAPVIIDVGANIGMFTLRAKQRWPGAQVYCYEPSPSNFAQLEHHVQINDLRDCHLHERGIGGTTRRAALFLHPRNCGGHSISQAHRGERSIEIELVDLKTALDETPQRRCDLMKLDCEGAEHEIVRSMDADAASRVDRIVLESRSGPALSETLAHLEALGYRPRAQRGLWCAVHRRLARDAAPAL